MDQAELARLARILEQTRSIALVGASNRPERASYQVMDYLLQQGFNVHPVNPQLAGAVILGQACVAELDELEQPVQLVNVFRRGEFAALLAEQAIEQDAQCLWLQEGVICEAAEELAKEADLDYVADLCIKKVHQQLMQKA
ncbi:CoA-binding protein [Oceanisphaera profunda]|uniref:CoA-binding protein n=1 Tax=Oceanisphaera profunda TaxID=1416627 RepID=A0A1Y0D6J9_9GAMM|nr:CoA-binding protein [Oceanisphaera profunda]ART82796.1 CoA-binding protein [Oceanisphaera profunda]